MGKKKISLKKGTDFTVSISVNLKSRKGEVVFKGKGNFGGSKKIKISVSGKGTNNTSNNTSDWKTRMYKFIQLDAYKNKASWPAAKKPLISSYGCKGCRAYAADFVAYVYGKRNSKKDPVINKYKDYTDKS